MKSGFWNKGLSCETKQLAWYGYLTCASVRWSYARIEEIEIYKSQAGRIRACSTQTVYEQENPES
jgi:hypothetical protein